MDRAQAIPLLREACNALSGQITQMHPKVAALNDPPAQAEMLKALFELTKHVEVIKKHLLRTEKRDDSALL